MSKCGAVQLGEYVGFRVGTARNAVPYRDIGPPGRGLDAWLEGRTRSCKRSGEAKVSGSTNNH